MAKSVTYNIKINEVDAKFVVNVHDDYNNTINFSARATYDNSTYFTANDMNIDSFNNIKNGLDNIDGYKTDIYHNKINDSIRFSSVRDTSQTNSNGSYYTGISLYKIG